MRSIAKTVTGATGVNGDAYYINTHHRVFCVVDGASGSADKQLFSRLCLEALDDTLQNEEHPLEEVLPKIFREANRRLIAASQRDDRLYYGTMTIAMIQDSRIGICSMGDSPAFLINEHLCQRLDTPRKRYQTLVDQGIRTREEIEDSISTLLPELWSAFEVFLPAIILKPEVNFYNCSPGDILALCSDGISDYVSPEELRLIIERCNSLEEACEETVDEVKKRCSPEKLDDMTVVLVTV